jgi:hypothetical protein
MVNHSMCSQRSPTKLLEQTQCMIGDDDDSYHGIHTRLTCVSADSTGQSSEDGRVFKSLLNRRCLLVYFRSSWFQLVWTM